MRNNEELNKVMNLKNLKYLSKSTESKTNKNPNKQNLIHSQSNQSYLNRKQLETKFKNQLKLQLMTI